MTTDPMKSADPLRERLHAVAHASPDLSEIVRTYEAILPLLRDADLRGAPLSMTGEQAREKMMKGLPLLHDINLEYDDGAARELMIQLARAVEKSSAENQAGPIRSALEENRLDAGSLLAQVASGDRDAVTEEARRLDLDAGLVRALAQNALRPALRAWYRQLAPLAQGIPWHKGSCFVCGAPATLAELQENNLVKHLRCGQCGADWRVPRLQCMYCGNEDHRTLKHFSPESNRETARVEACDRCHTYLKVITAFVPSSPEMLIVEDLAMLHLDYIAEERGYAAMPPSS
jgi:FdhE protein